MLSLNPLVELQIDRSLSEYITALVWSPVGNKLAIASGAGEVVLWQKDFQETVLQTASDASIDALSFSGKGQWLAAAGQAGVVTIWRLPSESSEQDSPEQNSPERVETLSWGSAWIDCLQWHPHQPWLACNCGKTVRIWDADQGKALTTLELSAHVQDLSWSPDGTHLAVSAQKQVHIWEASDWSDPQYEWTLLAASRILKWSPEGAYLASANQDNSVGILTWRKVRALKQAADNPASDNPASENQASENQAPGNPDDLPDLLGGFPGKVRQLAWADIPDAERSPILAIATRELVVMWMLVPDEGWQNWVLDLHQYTVLDVDFQAQTGLLASLSEDGWILLWQAAVEPVQVLEGAQEGFACLTWHPSGEYLAAGGQQGEVLVWALCPDARERILQQPEALL